MGSLVNLPALLVLTGIPASGALGSFLSTGFARSTAFGALSLDVHTITGTAVAFALLDLIVARR